jgi:hypothetical protein
MPLIVRSTAALSWFIGSFGFIGFFSEGTWSARGWRCPTGASGSNCWSETPAGFREPAGRAIVGAAMFGAGAELSWKHCPLRWDRLPHCSVHQRLLGPAQYHRSAHFPLPPNQRVAKTLSYLRVRLRVRLAQMKRQVGSRP